MIPSRLIRAALAKTNQQPSTRAASWATDLTEKPRCEVCGFLLDPRGRCALECETTT